jgi:hypothetical protein
VSYLPALRASLIDAAERAAGQADVAAAAAADTAADAIPARDSRRRADLEGVGLTPPGRRLAEWVRSAVLHPTPRGAAVNAALIVASVALGLTASGVFKRGASLGSPTPATPGAREGTAIPASVELLPVRTPDPAGGLPWGLRVVRTTRGLTCVTVGRVDYGTVGVLGIDGAFGDDNRFHPLSPNYFLGLGCDITDAAGHGFVNVSLRGVPASGLWGEHPASVGGCEPEPLSPASRRLLRKLRLHGHVAATSTAGPCPSADMRQLYFGLLGPHAQSITYLLPDGGERSARVEKPAGAYLIVLPATPAGGNPLATGDTGGPTIAAGEITRVRYDSGHVCTVPRASLFPSCPPVGFVAPQRTVPSAHRLASPISVQKVAAGSYCVQRTGNAIVACEGRPPPGFQHTVPAGEPALLVRVSFVSHVAIRSSASYYDAELEFSHSRSCKTGGMGGPTDYDIRAGQRVRFDMLIPKSCPGLVHGTIGYVPTSGAASSMPIIGLPGQGRSILVGRFSFRNP